MRLGAPIFEKTSGPEDWVEAHRRKGYSAAYCPNLTSKTEARAYARAADIIDAVRPVRTVYALETMPWMFPDSIDSYERLLAAVDRPALGVHFDPVNLINCPERYFHNAHYSREVIRRLGGRIRSVHLKDIHLADQLTVHLAEVRPGLGVIDYRVLLAELERLNPDIPVLCEHLPGPEEYDLAVDHIRSVAR